MFYFMVYVLSFYVLFSILCYVIFYVLFYVLYMFHFMFGGTLFYYRTLILVQFLLFHMIAFHFSQYRSLVSPFLLVSVYPNHQGKWDTAIHDGIALLPWKQAKFNLWAFCSLRRKGKSLIMQMFGFIWFMKFELRFVNLESLTLP